MSKPLARIETPSESQVEYYPQATQAAIQQMAVFWPAEELGVEEDEADFRGMPEGDAKAILTLQRYLSKIERVIGGDDFWGGRIGRMFPRHEIQRASSVFAMVENNSHAPFYRIGNEVIGVATDEFYEEINQIPVFNEHIQQVVKHARSNNKIEATVALTFLEGVPLYSAFAWFKSYGVRGHHLIPHFIAGIDGSAKDENFHCMFSAWLVNQLIKERDDLGLISELDKKLIHRDIIKIAKQVYLHEVTIINYIMKITHGMCSYNTIDKEELVHFVQDRVNTVLGYFGLEPMFDHEPGEVSSWFYSQLNAYKFQDFFATTQLQYRRNWRKHELVFNPEV